MLTKLNQERKKKKRKYLLQENANWEWPSYLERKECLVNT